MKSIEEMKSSPRLLVVKEGFDGLMGAICTTRGIGFMLWPLLPRGEAAGSTLA